MSTRAYLLTVSLALACAGRAAADQEVQVKADERRLEAAGVKLDGAALLGFLRHRTLSDADRESVRLVIDKLGGRAYRVREQAAAELVARGPVVIELLREHLKDADLEVARRAEKCIQAIKEKDHAIEVPAAVVRLLAGRRPAGAVEALLAYLPFADNENVADEVRNALAALAIQEKQPDKALVAALRDKNAVRRAAAGEALCRAKVEDQKAAVEALLKDADPTVRFRVAVALTMAKDRKAVPELIDLLVPLPQALAWQAEDILCRLAEGLEPPAVSLGTDGAARKKARDAWDRWWRERGAKVDLAKLRETPRLLGHTVLVLLDMGRVMEVDAADKVRWKIDGLMFPLDVQYLPNDRVLVAEYHGQRVTERDLNGTVKWQRMLSGGPLAAQRLANGNTFIATDSQLLEVNRAGDEVFNFSFPDGLLTKRIMKAMKLDNGEMVCLTSDARVVRLDPKGKEMKSFTVDLGMRLYGGRIHMLRNGRVLVPHNAENKVVEYDVNGKAVWEVAIDQPVAAVRLPNGNTLVTTMTQNRAVEFDRDGNVRWEFRSNTRVTPRALRR